VGVNFLIPEKVLKEWEDGETYQKTYKLVYGKVRKAITDISDQEVEDIVSTIFCDLQKYLKTGYEGKSSIETVLHTITDRRISDRVKSKYTQKGFLYKVANELEPVVGREPENLFDSDVASIFTKVLDSMEALTDKEKVVFVERAIAEKEGRDVAVELGLSEASVKNIYKESKKKLAKVLKEAFSEKIVTLPVNEQVEWLDKFYHAYLRLAEKKDMLTEGIKLASAQGYKAIKKSVKGESNG